MFIRWGLKNETKRNTGPFLVGLLLYLSFGIGYNKDGDKMNWLIRTFNWSRILELICWGLAIGCLVYFGIYIIAPFKIEFIWR